MPQILRSASGENDSHICCCPVKCCSRGAPPNDLNPDADLVASGGSVV